MKRRNAASTKVRKYAAQNPHASVREIATAIGCSYDLAYNVLWKDRKDAEKITNRVLSRRIEAHLAESQTPEQEVHANDVQIGGDHYKGKSIQPWDYIVANRLGYLEGNVVKYITRWPQKGGVKDLEKARHYLDKLIETAK